MTAIIRPAYVLCPHCNQSRHEVQHLYDDAKNRKQGVNFGPWHCDACQYEFSGTVAHDPENLSEPCAVTFTRLQARKRIPKLSLFRLRDLYLVVDSYGDDQSEDRDPMWYDYLFHSHQCPTNMLKNVVELFDNSERDPHGVLRFVSAIDDTEENRKRLDESPTKEELFRLFQTDGQDAHSHWPEENKGVIPWIAAMRRGAGIPVSSFSVKITSSEEDIKQGILKADITQNLDKSEMEKQVIEYMTKALEGIIGKEKW